MRTLKNVTVMTESTRPVAKKAKRSVLLSHVTAEGRGKKFKIDLYGDGGVLFCRFSEHSIDFTCIDTMKEHLKSKKHIAKKEAKTRSSDVPSTTDKSL